MFSLPAYLSAMTVLSGAPRGRGAQTNATGRFESLVRSAFDDGWTAEDETPPRLKTEVTPERSKTIIARNTSPDVGFDRSINPYRGCEHGCIYWVVTHLPGEAVGKREVSGALYVLPDELQR
jgi:hypothetical protein